MKQSFINKIVLCEKCRQAFIINVEGNETTCDTCISESELKSKLIDEGVINGVVHDCY